MDEENRASLETIPKVLIWQNEPRGVPNEVKGNQPAAEGCGTTHIPNDSPSALFIVRETNPMTCNIVPGLHTEGLYKL